MVNRRESKSAKDAFGAKKAPAKIADRSRNKIKPAPPHQHRMCVACRGVSSQDELLRLIVKDGQLILADGLGGRGCYVHETKECVAKLCEVHRIEHAFPALKRASGKGASGKRRGGFKSGKPKPGTDVKPALEKQIRLDTGSVRRLVEKLVLDFEKLGR